MDIKFSLSELCELFVKRTSLTYAHDPDGVITYVNPDIENFLGHKSEHIIGKNIVDFVHPDDLSMVITLNELAKKQEITRDFVIKLIHKDGRVLTFEFIAHAIYQKGVYVGSVGVGKDVTAQQIRESALGRSENIYKVVVNNARDVIYTVSPEGVVTSVNEFMQQVTGFTAAEAIGKEYLYFVHPDEVHYGVQIHQSIMRGEKLPVLEMRFLKKDGTYLNGEFSITPLFYEGKFLGTLGIGRDISEKKKQEDAMKQALLKEKQVNELRRIFVSMVSHEFRNPLSIIDGMARILIREGTQSLGPDAQRAVYKIQENAERLTTMLEEIMLLVDDKGKTIFKPTPVKIQSYFSDIVTDVCQNNKSSQSVDLQFESGIDACLSVMIDREIIRHVVVNLLGNALKYSQNSSLPVSFKISKTSTHLTFSIEDHGIGIPKDYLDEIFMTISRASNVGKIPGTGMGLAIVKKFIDLHNGTIKISSVENQGTSVVVNIPIEIKSAA